MTAGYSSPASMNIPVADLGAFQAAADQLIRSGQWSPTDQGVGYALVILRRLRKSSDVRAQELADTIAYEVARDLGETIVVRIAHDYPDEPDITAGRLARYFVEEDQINLQRRANAALLEFGGPEGAIQTINEQIGNLPAEFAILGLSLGFTGSVRGLNDHRSWRISSNISRNPPRPGGHITFGNHVTSHLGFLAQDVLQHLPNWAARIKQDVFEGRSLQANLSLAA